MIAYYKAVRSNGRDFHTDTVDYGAALLSGEPVMAPRWDQKVGAAGYLSVSVEPADCTGFKWPCRLFRVEPVGRAFKVEADLPNKRAVRGVRVVEELPAWQAFGPNGEAVAALIEQAERLTADEADRLHTAWEAARDAARYAAWGAARDAACHTARFAAWSAAGYATWDAARDATWDAALALVVRDLITPQQYQTLAGPWESVMGAIA